MNDFILPSKAELKHMKVEEITKPLPDLKNRFESRAMVIAKWLMELITESLKSGAADEKTLLPSKPDLAYLLGVSIGTIQNSLRVLEDNGYVESKQCIGTLIRNPELGVKKMRKLTSKREIAINEIKKFIVNKELEVGASLPSSRVMAGIINCSTNTTRLAMEHLTHMGIIEHNYRNGTENGWVLLSRDFEIVQELAETANETLVKKVEQDLKA